MSRASSLGEKDDSDEENYHNPSPNREIGDGWTVLHAAAYLNRVKVVEELVRCEHVVLTSRSLTRGQTALHVACCLGHTEIVMLLIGAISQRESENGSAELWQGQIP